MRYEPFTATFNDGNDGAPRCWVETGRRSLTGPASVPGRGRRVGCAYGGRTAHESPTKNEVTVDTEHARELLKAQREELTELLGRNQSAVAQDLTAEDEQGADIDDPAQPLTQEGVDDAISASVRERLTGVDRAEARLAAGTYGKSVLSGDPIPDERLEAEPSAELTVDEQAEKDRAEG
jgi:DnaK suppressor protein